MLIILKSCREKYCEKLFQKDKKRRGNDRSQDQIGAKTTTIL